jgi:pullulanase/glycogen debranching enzyme
LQLRFGSIARYGFGGACDGSHAENTNPYNLENATSWLDWSRLDVHRDMFHFFQRIDRIPESASEHRAVDVLA